jgi:hypothetical protein
VNEYQTPSSPFPCERQLGTLSEVAPFKVPERLLPQEMFCALAQLSLEGAGAGQLIEIEPPRLAELD